ncbi:hypothetical protein [Bradyrhizobium tropiciagri]|uniref:hypothetical protein n=1 Tax=Bradyrhizobium tropiciagri TaxID=312253 RepID=UPI00067D39B8|nr:hypothetical protein [Bradyrhizobium tropiciagri]
MTSISSTLDRIERDYLQDIGDFERDLEREASRMTLNEVDAELQRLPASPETDRDLLARAAMMRRRLELLAIDAKQSREAPPPSPALFEVNIPPDVGATCIWSLDRRKYFYPEERHGRMVIMLPWETFHKLAFSTRGKTAGATGAAWLAANPHLVDRLPKREQPPIAETPTAPALSW